MGDAYKKSEVDGYEYWDRQDTERRHVSNHIKLCREAGAVPYFAIKLSGQEPQNYELIEMAMYLWVVKKLGSKRIEFLFKHAIETIEFRARPQKQDLQQSPEEAQP